MTEPPCPRRLWLVRHGESTWNASLLVQGQAAGPVLTERGRAQAETAGEALAAEPVGAVFASDLDRARESAERIASHVGLPVVYDDRLRERSFGTAEGRPQSALAPEHSGVRGGWVVDADAAPPGGESVRQLYRRATTAVQALVEGTDEGDVVLVTHGGVVRVVLAWLAGTGPEHMPWGPVGNAALLARALSLVGTAPVPAPAC